MRTIKCLWCKKMLSENRYGDLEQHNFAKGVRYTGFDAKKICEGSYMSYYSMSRRTEFREMMEDLNKP